jgi:hypothetical protein
VIDVRDDAKIARQSDSHESDHYAGVAVSGQLATGTAALSNLPVSRSPNLNLDPQALTESD